MCVLVSVLLLEIKVYSTIPCCAPTQPTRDTLNNDRGAKMWCSVASRYNVRLCQWGAERLERFYFYFFLSNACWREMFSVKLDAENAEVLLLWWPMLLSTKPIILMDFFFSTSLYLACCFKCISVSLALLDKVFKAAKQREPPCQNDFW